MPEIKGLVKTYQDFKNYTGYGNKKSGSDSGSDSDGEGGGGWSFKGFLFNIVFWPCMVRACCAGMCVQLGVHFFFTFRMIAIVLRAARV